MTLAEYVRTVLAPKARAHFIEHPEAPYQEIQQKELEEVAGILLNARGEPYADQRNQLRIKTNELLNVEGFNIDLAKDERGRSDSGVYYLRDLLVRYQAYRAKIMEQKKIVQAARIKTKVGAAVVGACARFVETPTLQTQSEFANYLRTFRSDLRELEAPKSNVHLFSRRVG